MKATIENYFDTISKNFEVLKKEAGNINNATKFIINALKNHNKIIFCGNGGSAGDSQHLAAELMGRYKKDRSPLPAIALTVDTSALTAIGNDYGYEKVFSRQLQGIGKTGDVLVGISTSGKSQNVIEAIKLANEIGIQTICFTGDVDTELTKISSCAIKVPSKETNHIQEMHIAVGQLICGLVEDHFFSKD